MFWRCNRHWNAFNRFVIVYYKTLGTAFETTLKHLFYFETDVFSCKIFAVTVWKIGPDRVKRRK